MSIHVNGSCIGPPVLSRFPSSHLSPPVEIPSMRLLKRESTSIRPRGKGERLEDTCRSRSECPGVRQCANARLARDSLRNMPMLIRSVYSRLDTIRAGARSFLPALLYPGVNQDQVVIRQMLQPPSMIRVCPVVKADSSEAR
jgi:hypothetical protein